jgi:hypothetical protein
MENLNAYVRTKEFCDSRKKPITSIEDFNSREFDTWINATNASTFVIEISGATTIEAKVGGCINMTDVDGSRLEPSKRPYVELALVNLSTFQVVNTITDNGLYQVSTSGIPEVVISIEKLEGNVVIVGAGSDD